MSATHQTSRISCFLRGRVKSSKNTISIYRWPKNDSLFRDQVLVSFFRKSAKQWGELDFCGVKNASKNDENYAFWRAPRTIRRRRSGFQTGVQNHAKWRWNASKVTAKWPRKIVNIDIAMIKNACRRLTCENASKLVHFCRSRYCFAHAMDSQQLAQGKGNTAKVQAIRAAITAIPLPVTALPCSSSWWPDHAHRERLFQKLSSGIISRMEFCNKSHLWKPKKCWKLNPNS